jgi:hypothetical protein
VTSFRIGFEVKSGREVVCEAQHLGITGLTQQSGKTTALEAFISRLDATTCVIVFRTGRGEIGFDGARRIPPFFRERTDWQFVEGLIGAHLHEKTKFYRGDVMLAVRGAHSLSEVHANIRARLTKTKKEWTQKVLVELDQYFNEIVPLLAEHVFALDVEVGRGVRVMDLEGMPIALQQLVIASTVDKVMEEHRDVLFVLPEARDFIPEGERTPAKLALERLIRRGAKLGNFLWVDSQSLTGLDMDVMRSVGTWLFGRQVLDLELKRVTKMVPGLQVGKIHADDIRRLGLGEFLLVRGATATRVYVQPAWLDDNHAQRVAQGIDSAAEMIRLFKSKGENVDDKERKKYEERIASQDEEIKRLTTRVSQLSKRLEEEAERVEANAKAAAANAVEKGKGAPTPSEFTRLLDETATHAASGRTKVDPHDITVTHEVPSVTVRQKLPVVDTSTKEMVGRIALLIAEGFWNGDTKRQADAGKEFVRRGFGAQFAGGGASVALSRAFAQMTLWGFLRREEDGSYSLTPGVEKRVRVVTEA